MSVIVVLVGVANSDDLHFLHLLDDTTLDTAGGDRTATFDREHVLDRHQEILVDRDARAAECNRRPQPSVS